MVRPRNALMALDASLSSKDASDILRRVNGDLEAAERYIATERNKKKKKIMKSSPSINEQSEAKDNSKQTTTVATTNTTITSPNASTNKPTTLSNLQQQSKKKAVTVVRAPPRHTVSINNLSDRQYCCVWSVEVYEDGYRPDVARTLLAAVARHVNPVLRDRGWRCKRLIESASSKWIGLCTSNARADADAASTNIQLNLRTQPNKHCTTFRSFRQILAVMLHEITHTSIGLEDIHPPAFYELLTEIKIQYKEKLVAGEVDLETDDYGCNGKYINRDGSVGSVASSSTDLLEHNSADNNIDDNMLNTAEKETEQCGASKKKGKRGRRKYNVGGKSKGYISNVIKEKKRPLLKGAKLIDKRTKVGKEAMSERANLTPRELAAKAATARFSNNNSNGILNGSGNGLGKNNEGIGNYGVGDEIYIDDDNSSTDKESDRSNLSDDDDDDNNENERIVPHLQRCGCRSCDWSKNFQQSMT